MDDGLALGFLVVSGGGTITLTLAIGGLREARRWSRVPDCLRLGDVSDW